MRCRSGGAVHAAQALAADFADHGGAPGRVAERELAVQAMVDRLADDDHRVRLEGHHHQRLGARGGRPLQLGKKGGLSRAEPNRRDLPVPGVGEGGRQAPQASSR